MPRFRIRAVDGKTVRRGLGVEFFGYTGFFAFDANNRAEAYIQLCNYAAGIGKDVTVIDVQNPPLGFSFTELQFIKNAGVQITPGTPKDGFQIEEIIQLDE